MIDQDFDVKCMTFSIWFNAAIILSFLDVPQNVKAVLAPLGDSVLVSWDNEDDSCTKRFLIEYCLQNSDDWKPGALNALNSNGPHPITGLPTGKSYR